MMIDDPQSLTLELLKHASHMSGRDCPSPQLGRCVSACLWQASFFDVDRRRSPNDRKSLVERPHATTDFHYTNFSAMPRRSQLPVETWYKPPIAEICPLCQRPIPADQRDEHHLVPKTKGGRVTQFMHRICHRQIHALFTEAELAQHYNTVEELLTHPEMLKFVEWVRTKPNGFYERSRMSHRRR